MAHRSLPEPVERSIGEVMTDVAGNVERLVRTEVRLTKATVIQAALSRIGSPYVWGGSGPNQFDCSGLVMWSFQQAGISLPHSSQALAQGGQPVSRDQMQPGDLVTYYSDASHVAIYIGDGMMVHASTYGTPVRVAPVDNAPIYNVRRY